MRIGFDAKRLFLNDSGLGNYSRTLVSTLQQHYPGDDWVLFTPKQRKTPQTEPFFHEPFRTIKPERTPAMLHSWWRTMAVSQIASKEQIDVFHGLSNELPEGLHHRSIRSVVTVHDLIFLRFPEYYPTIDRFFYLKKMKRACETADVVVAISERTSADLQELLDVDPSRIRVIYQGAEAAFSTSLSTDALREVRHRFGVQDRPYLLSVGTIERRKNQRLTVEAFAASGLANEVDLVLIGRQTAYAREVLERASALGIAHRVHAFQGVAFNDLLALLRGATATVYASRYEGFGLPVLESMCAGVPVLAASGSCLEEVGGGAARYFHPDDHDQLATLMRQVVEDPSLASEMRQLGLERCLTFDNNLFAASYHQLYKELL